MRKFPKPWFRPSRKTWFVTLDGKQINLGRDKRQAFEQYKRLLAKPRSQSVTPRSMAVLIDAFLDWTQKYRAADTFEWYRYRLQRFIDQYPRLLIDQLRPHHVQVWVDSYPNLSMTSRRNYIRSVKRCLRWAHRQGYVETNPIEYLEAPSAESRDVSISDDEFKQLLSLVRDSSFAELLIVTWETGCRPQESLRVESRHVDQENQRWVFPRAEAKMKRAPRIVYLTERAWEITQRLTEKYPEGCLFRNSRGLPWTTDAVNCAVDRLQIRMGTAILADRDEDVAEQAIVNLIPDLNPTRMVRGRKKQKTAAELRCEAKRKLTYRRAAELAPRYSLYSLRHAWATRALESGVDALTVAILMGHNDPSTLARVYQHLSHNPEHLLKQARRARNDSDRSPDLEDS